MVRSKEWLVNQGFNEERVQPASVDLHWSGRWCPSKAVVYELEPQFVVETWHKPKEQNYTNVWANERESKYLTLSPGGIYKISADRNVVIPPDHAALLVATSTPGRCGISIVTGGWFDPGYMGEVTMVIKNNMLIPTKIRRGQAIAQLVFLTLDAKTSPYDGNYGQSTK